MTNPAESITRPFSFAVCATAMIGIDRMRIKTNVLRTGYLRSSYFAAIRYPSRRVISCKMLRVSRMNRRTVAKSQLTV